MTADTAQPTLTRGQVTLLVLLTVVWGLNWPVLKVGVSGLPADPQTFPPLTFRALSMGLGLPLMALTLKWMRQPLWLAPAHWPQMLQLSVPNMIVWHTVIIVAVQSLSSGRAAILAYTMPAFVLIWGLALYRERPTLRQWVGVGAATVGVVFLLSHEFERLSGAPWAAMQMVGAAGVWALGTHMLRKTTCPASTMTLALWMTGVTFVVLCILAALVESAQWRTPPAHVWFGIVYNAVGVFAFAHTVWFYLARNLPPLASSISVMLIPVMGVFSGAVFLGEPLHWQDLAAVVMIVLAIVAIHLKRSSSS